MNTMDAVQLDFFSADPNNRPMLLSAIGEGIRNDFSVHTTYRRVRMSVNSEKVTAAVVVSIWIVTLVLLIVRWVLLIVRS